MAQQSLLKGYYNRTVVLLSQMVANDFHPNQSENHCRKLFVVFVESAGSTLLENNIDKRRCLIARSK